MNAFGHILCAFVHSAKIFQANISGTKITLYLLFFEYFSL